MTASSRLHAFLALATLALVSGSAFISKTQIKLPPKTTTSLSESGRAYHFPTEVTPSLYKLPKDGLPDDERKKALQEIGEFTKKWAHNFAGFQSTAQLDTEHLSPFIRYAINNIGDSFANPELTEPGSVSPLADGYFGLNSKWIERAVLDFFAEEWNAPQPRTVKEDYEEELNLCNGDEACMDDINEKWRDSYWGYVLSMGSTEGNLMALRSARDYLKGRQLLYGSGARAVLRYEDCDDKLSRAFDPVLLYSDASHYSIKKLAQMLEFESEEIETNEHGEIDLDDLKRVTEYVVEKEHRPVAVCFNYGTSWTGGLDNVESGIKIVKKVLEENDMLNRTIYMNRRPACVRNGFWFHCDGALGAGYATFVEKDGDFELPKFDFTTGIQSISMSGHKWPGAPWPTGIYMTKNKYMLTNDVPAYVGSLDSTLAGSRSGIAPIFLWDWLARSYDSYNKTEEAEGQLELAQYALEEIQSKWDSKATRARGSIMVVFRKPKLNEAGAPEFVNKYSLSANGDQVHLVCVRHVNKTLVNDMILDLQTFTKPEDFEMIPAKQSYVLDSFREGY